MDTTPELRICYDEPNLLSQKGKDSESSRSRTMSNISAAGQSATENQNFEVTGLKRTTILTGNHHAKPKNLNLELGRSRTMSENDQNLV